MHGAAQTAKAPPSRTREPRPRASCEKTGADEPLGPRQEAHEREPEHDEHEPGDPLEQELIAEDPPPDERGTDAEQHEERREPDHERHARRGRRVARCPAGRAGRHRRPRPRRGTRGRAEARTARGTRPSPRRTRPGSRSSSSVIRRSARAPRPRAARASGRAGRLVGGGGPRRRLQDRIRNATTTAPASERAERQEPGEQPEAALRAARRGRPSPNCGDECVLDLLLRVARRDAYSDERLHALRDRGIRLVEGRLADRADDLGLEIRPRSEARSRRRPRSRLQGRRAARSVASRITRARPAIADSSRARSSSPFTAPANAGDHLPLAVDDERLGEARHAVAVDRIARPVVHEREGELEAPCEATCVCAEVLRVEPDDDEASVAVLLATPARGTAPPPCMARTTTPRRSARPPCRAATRAEAARPRRGARA